MREYNPETDYHVVIEAARQAGCCDTVSIKEGLNEAGIAWPKNYNEDTSPSTVALDMDICRAWRELGLHP
jgi:hypothetical protein